MENKESVLRIKKEQEKALDVLKYSKNEDGRKKQLVDELKDIKLENKVLAD
jgi:hypothetical protein